MADNNEFNIGEGGTLPIGFGLNLAANQRAMEAFSNMSDSEKQQVVDASRNQHTRSDMANFVDRLGNHDKCF